MQNLDQNNAGISQVPSSNEVISRMVSAVFALLGALIALYLVVYDLGLSPLVCPIKGCEVVQASVYAKILGVPVAIFGVIGFVTLLAVSIWGLSSRLLLGIQVRRVLLGLSGLGLLAYLWFSYLELFVIHAICFWCVTSSLMMLGVFISAFMLQSLKSETIKIPPSQ